MSDVSEVTRVVSLSRTGRRCDALNEGTRLAALAGENGPPNLRGLFERHQLEMAARIDREKRMGVMCFAVGPERLEGSMWLSATSRYRAGSIGRHGCADLFLSHATDLSLRHSLVLVQRLGRGVRMHILDLSSTQGLYLENESRVRAIDSDGHVLLGAGRYLLAFFVTGLPLPWEPYAWEPFKTLAPRVITSMDEQPQHMRPLFWRKPEQSCFESTQVPRPGPEHLGTDSILMPEEIPAGRLTLVYLGRRQHLLIGFSALDKGVLLGRYDRCHGAEALDEPGVSRVHATILRRNNRIILADVGSQNGTWIGEKEIRCADITNGATFRLGNYLWATWEPLD